LAVRGTILGTIAKLTEGEHGGNTSTLLRSWREAVRVDEDGDESYPRIDVEISVDAPVRQLKPLDYSDAFWMTICMGTVTQSSPLDGAVVKISSFIQNPEAARWIHESWWRRVNKASSALIQMLYGVSEEDIRGFNGLVSNAIYRRRLFVTSDNLGLMGTGPLSAQVGDAIALMEGASTPIIVRKDIGITAENGRRIPSWKVVGDSYVQGIMHGEGLSFGEMEEIILT
jgi:hypothetical protein